MTELFTAIFNSGGMLGLFAFVSLLINLGLAGILFKYFKNRSHNRSSTPFTDLKSEIDHVLVSKKSANKAELEMILSSASDDHLKQVEKMLDHIKDELRLAAINENQPIREMLLKISSAIELLAKAIEYATQRDASTIVADYIEKRK